jgi:ATP-binding protein involved in chromosome partitioning
MGILGKKSGGSPPLDEKAVLEALRPIQDPDLHRSIVELGFIQNIRIDDGLVSFDLQLTTPACPMKEMLRKACTEALQKLPGVRTVSLNLTAKTRGAPSDKRAMLQSVRNIIAVASGKGGVGKSTTAVNIAIGLAQSGASVGILDADIYGPSIPMMLKVETPPSPAGDNRMFPATASGLKLMSMAFFMRPGQAAILRGPMASGTISQFLGNVEWGELDYLVIDYPPGTGDVQLTLSQQAPISGAIITTTPQEISLIDVDRAIQMFETTKVPVLGVCETMSYFVCDGCGKKHSIFRSGGGRRVAGRAGVPFLGGVPIDPLVADSGDGGVPILLSHPDSPAALAYREIAGAVAAELSILSVERGSYLETFSLEWKA